MNATLAVFSGPQQSSQPRQRAAYKMLAKLLAEVSEVSAHPAYERTLPDLTAAHGPLWNTYNGLLQSYDALVRHFNALDMCNNGP